MSRIVAMASHRSHYEANVGVSVGVILWFQSFALSHPNIHLDLKKAHLMTKRDICPILLYCK